ncbi:hypothetical protein BLX88_06060 [Bacillus obstructivus]|nr:hypothetical protein BLX88_06060 [Bacillus obstructivus]
MSICHHHFLLILEMVVAFFYEAKKNCSNPIVKNETTNLEFNFTFDYLISAKNAEDLREKTIKSYFEHYFFINWIK